jgi:hypothetical protein
VLILQPVETPPFVGKPIKMTPVPPRLRSLKELEQTAVNPRVLAALFEVSRRLTLVSVRHAVLGAIAVGVHGWPRATQDVDLLLGPEAWHQTSDGSMMPKVDLPEQIDGVGIDYLPISIAGDFLLEAFDRALVSDGVPVAPIEHVILTKLVRLAMRDAADVVELLKAGLFDAGRVEAYVQIHAPMLTRRFQELREQAAREIARGD